MTNVFKLYHKYEISDKCSVTEHTREVLGLETTTKFFNQNSSTNLLNSIQNIKRFNTK